MGQNKYLKIVKDKVDPFAGELYRYLNFNERVGFEHEGRVISLKDMALLFYLK